MQASLATANPRRRRRRWTSRAVLPLGLTALLLLIFALAGIDPDHAVPLAVLLGLAGYQILSAALDRRSDLFEPINWLAGYFVLYFGLRAIYVMADPAAHRIGMLYYDDYLAKGLWCAVIGYLACYWGYRSGLVTAILRRLPCIPLDWPSKVPVVRICILLAIGCASWIYLIRSGVGVVGNAADNALRAQTNPVSGVPILLNNLLNFAFVAVCISLASRPRPSNRGWAHVLLVLCLILIGITVLVSGGKQFLLAPLMQALIVYHYLRKRVRFALVLGVGLPALLVTFGVLNMYRFTLVPEMGGAPTSVSGFLDGISYAWDATVSDRSQGMDNRTFEGLMDRQFGVDALALTIKYTPERRGFGYGESYLQIPVYAFIPRPLWANKPIHNPSGDFERDYLAIPPGSFTSMHVISNLYQNFHIPGIVAGMFLIGASLRLLYLACQLKSVNRVGIFVYALLLPELIHGLEGEPVVDGTAYSRLILLLMVVVYWLGVRRWNRVQVGALVR